MWVGTVTGLLQLTRRGSEWMVSGSFLRGATIRSVHVDARDVIWVASSSGFARLSASGAPIATSWGGRFRQVTSFTSNADGTVWFYDEGRGLLRVKDGHVEHLELGSDLLGVNRTVLHLDRRNRLWLVGDAGVELRGADGDIRRYTTADGLQDAAYRSIYEDREGIIWFGSTAGVSRLIDGRIESVGIVGARRSSWVKRPLVRCRTASRCSTVCRAPSGRSAMWPA
jgi:ligand-binding sensor domain-containing protein